MGCPLTVGSWGLTERERQMGNSNGSKFTTYLVQAIILTFAFIVLSAVFAFCKEFIREIFRITSIAQSLSPETHALFYGLSMALMFATIVFPGMAFAWKLSKKVNFERTSDKREGPQVRNFRQKEESQIDTQGKGPSIQTGNVIVSEAEIKRTIYARLLKEKKDEATMLQAKVECGGDADKAEPRYYQLRYKQIVESGESDKIREKLLGKKSEEAAAPRGNKAKRMEKKARG